LTQLQSDQQVRVRWDNGKEGVYKAVAGAHQLKILDSAQAGILLTLTNLRLGIRIVFTQPFWAALGTESTVCYTGNTADRQPQ
jgi:hypothetical protein